MNRYKLAVLATLMAAGTSGWAQTDAKAALVKQLQDHVKASIAPFKYPREIEFVQALPRTETGKLQRFKLKQL